MLLDPSSALQRHAHSHETAFALRTGFVMNSQVMLFPDKARLLRALLMYRIVPGAARSVHLTREARSFALCSVRFILI
jgi:hypothetical protein